MFQGCWFHLFASGVLQYEEKEASKDECGLYIQ